MTDSTKNHGLARVWNEEEYELLRTEWAKGTPIGQIGDLIGCSHTHIADVAKKIGLPVRGHDARIWWTEERNQTLRDLWPTHSQSQLARLLGTTRSAVGGQLGRLGLAGMKNPSPAKSHDQKLVSRRERRAQRKKLVEAGVAQAITRISSSIQSGQRPPALPSWEEGSTAVALLDLKNNQCRWPVCDDARGVTTHFCGATCVQDTSYCHSHLAVAYRPVREMSAGLMAFISRRSKLPWRNAA